MNEKLKTPEQRYEEAALELALYQMIRREQAALEQQLGEEGKAQADSLAEETAPAMLRRMEHCFARRASGRQAVRPGRVAWRLAAAVLVAVNLALAIGMAAIPSLRQHTARLLASLNRATPTPQGTQGYFLTELPPHDGLRILEYENSQGQYISILISDAAVAESICTDGSELLIQGNAEIIIHKPFEPVYSR